jgi:hypothetical protein
MSRKMARRRWHGTGLAVSCLIVLSAAPSGAQDPPKPCRDGFVMREAFPGDRVCVTPQTHAQVLADNSQAEARREPGGGPYGPMTCRQGFVWRVARPDDLVCVTPEIRAQTAADNAAHAATGVATAPPPPPPPQPQPAPPKPAYRLGNWSPSRLQDGLTYRYRWGLDPASPKVLDAIFEVRNGGTAQWVGSVRSADCDRGVLADSKPVTLAGHDTQQVTFRTANCGDADVPFFKPGVARTVRFD